MFDLLIQLLKGWGLDPQAAWMVSLLFITLLFSALLAFALGVMLGIFKKMFEIKRDPFVDTVRAALPGANCGACGYPGCEAYAEAIAAKRAPTTACTTGGSTTAEALGKLMGVSAKVEDMRVVLLCQGRKELSPLRGEYVGIKNCRAAKISINSSRLCTWGCMGFGDCVKACKFDALSIGDGGIPVVDYAKCSGCGMCTFECPQKLLALVPLKRVGAVTLCSNRSVLKAQVIKNCKIGCIKCEACVRACPVQCIRMENGIPVVDYAKCTNCGECVAKCPTKSMKLLQSVRGEA